MRFPFAPLVVVGSAIFLAASRGLGDDSANADIEADATVRFDRDIRPILSDKCIFCHGPDPEHREADLRLDLEDAAKDSAIVAGDIQASELIRRIVSEDENEIMPPPGAHKTLSEEEIGLIERWVTEGANWTRHWSFQSPQRAEIPAATADRPINTAIDRFIARRLLRDQMRWSPEADRETLIRRLTFDLTGLPPTIEEIEAFINDRSDHAYERVVDRLLQSRHYGERMALMWMDAARYGDTSVYHADGPRDMWAWRDAIVDAYNQNLPFDEFSILQIAGDLMPEENIGRRVLAGFNRNNGTTDEGGAIAEEYRVEYAVDRVKTTSTVWLGLSMECAQCHDHKYDPISQEDYYRFYAFFNVSADGGMQTRNGNAAPAIDIPDPDRQAKLPGVRQQIADVTGEMQSRADSSESAFRQWVDARESKTAGSPAAAASYLNVPLITGQGDSVIDWSSAQRQGKIHGKVDWVKSRYDWGLRLGGETYVDLGDVGDFERSDAFSYGGWVKPEKGKTGALLARMDDGNQHRGYDLLVGDGAISVHVIHAWPANAIKVVTKKRLKADQWHHVLATYDGSSKAKGIKIYVDGKAWDWKVEQDGLTDSIRTEKSMLLGSRHPGSRLQGVVDEVQVYERALTAPEVAVVADMPPVQAILALDPTSRTDEQLAMLREYYLVSEDPTYRQQKERLESLSKQEVELGKPLTTVMIMGDMEKPRDTFVLNRGAYDSPTDEKVDPGTLAILPPMDNDAPKNRLGLARWLFRDDHPLTARVAVNRYWQMLLGSGLVATPEDFGAQGDYPSHPELLDWLAVDFRESGWNVKRMIKQIVMSATYRQSSKMRPDHLVRDPNNRLFARSSRIRLQGEFIRDGALAVSGLLVNQLGGPGVKPYQPPGLWAEVGLGGNPKFVQDHGKDLYRRSLYTYWKRSAPPPTMQIFDAPTREKCTILRARTNTPLQALATLNDVQFVEASRRFAERFIHEGGRTREDRIRHAFRLATARTPSPSESDILEEIFTDALGRYREDIDAAKALLAAGESDRDEALDAAQHAAWTIVASSILNLDETLTRE